MRMVIPPWCNMLKQDPESSPAKINVNTTEQKIRGSPLLDSVTYVRCQQVLSSMNNRMGSYAYDAMHRGWGSIVRTALLVATQ